MDEPTMPGPDERYERIPWEQLMAEATGGDRRRWMVMGVVAIAIVGVVAFMLGSGGTAAAPTEPALPAPTVDTAPSSTTVATVVTEADLVAVADPDPTVAGGLESYLTMAFSGPTTVVDRVEVRGLGGSDYEATVELSEVTDLGVRPLAPVGVAVRANASESGVVVDRLQPLAAAGVTTPGTGGRVTEVPEPIREGLFAAMAPWPGAVVNAAGSDAGRWWAEVALPLPSGGSLTVVVWPELVVGLGSGG